MGTVEQFGDIMVNQEENIAAVTEDLKKLDTVDQKKGQGEEREVFKDITNNKETVDENCEIEEDKENMNSCNYCNKDGPSKRCSKRHPKCIKKLFCNNTCEELAHKKKGPTVTKKAEVKKKKKYTYKEPCQWAL